LKGWVGKEGERRKDQEKRGNEKKEGKKGAKNGVLGGG